MHSANLVLLWLDKFFIYLSSAVAHTWYWGSGYHIRGGPVCHEDHPEQRAAHSWTLSSLHSSQKGVCVWTGVNNKRRWPFILSYHWHKNGCFFSLRGPNHWQTFYTHAEMFTLTVYFVELVTCEDHISCLSQSAAKQTQDPNKRIVKHLDMHLAMWLQIFIFRLQSNI